MIIYHHSTDSPTHGVFQRHLDEIIQTCCADGVDSAAAQHDLECLQFISSVLVSDDAAMLLPVNVDMSLAELFQDQWHTHRSTSGDRVLLSNEDIQKWLQPRLLAKNTVPYLRQIGKVANQLSIFFLQFNHRELYKESVPEWIHEIQQDVGQHVDDDGMFVDSSVNDHSLSHGNDVAEVDFLDVEQDDRHRFVRRPTLLDHIDDQKNIGASLLAAIEEGNYEVCVCDFSFNPIEAYVMIFRLVGVL